MKKVLSWLDAYFEESIVLTLFAFLIINVLVEIFCRYCLHSSNQFSEEIAKMTLIAMIYMGVPYAIRYKRHIVCDVLPSTTSQKTQFAVQTVSTLLFFTMCIIMTLSCLELVEQQIMVNRRTESMHAPSWCFTSVIGIGFSLGALRLIQTFLQDLAKYRETGIAHITQVPEE